MTESSEGKALRAQILDAVPSLRAFARGLCNDRDRADDLVQETILKAWSNIERFAIGTNLRAWLFTIMRNHFYSEMRKQRREIADVDGVHAAKLTVRATQMEKVVYGEFERALKQLPSTQREALILVGPAGYSYEDAARICGCAVGTVKSRVNRGRARLTEMLEGQTSNIAPLRSNVA